MMTISYDHLEVFLKETGFGRANWHVIVLQPQEGEEVYLKLGSSRGGTLSADLREKVCTSSLIASGFNEAGLVNVPLLTEASKMAVISALVGIVFAPELGSPLTREVATCLGIQHNDAR